MSFISRKDFMRGLFAALVTFGAARAFNLDVNSSSTLAAMVAVLAALASAGGRLDMSEKEDRDAR